MRLTKIIACIFTVISGNSTLKAQNPVIQTHYTPDPAPMVYKDKVYVYTGDDIPGYDFYYMTKWRVFSSSDMVNWTDHGSPISLESFSWARDRAWAAQCIERNGKFYWYICAQTVQNNMALGVAVADSPIGPFKDALGKPLVTTGSWSNIDPTVFIDNDGQAYLYWGNGSLYYVKLNEDMISWTGDIVEVPQSAESFGGVRQKRSPDSKENPQVKDVYVEGPWFYKRAGKYYQMFAGMSKGGESLSYAMSDSPTGPWKYQGKIMSEQPTNSFTNHGGIIDFKGNSYLFYHTGLLPGGGSYGRATSIEAFKYNPDGTIPLISMTKDGVGAVGLPDAYKRIEAETIAWAEKCKTTQSDKGNIFVSEIRTGGHIKVRSVNFGLTSPKTFTASLASGLDGGVLDVHIDSLKGAKIASINVPRTGGWQSWKTFSQKVNENITGVHDLYFVFKGQNITAGRELFNFDYWQFIH
ncbi:carbohydrate binding protein with CBM6 domain [Arcticibacter tournemirensis]|uniref:Family 43 glycosylhydrolase n=1 Tax=Arcticibacter tournemirensis TaxID=699437 RepID=A0A5M9H8D0_9SPHI|nr:glycoside hydrolase family 43 protein [Arcticibacter tournemirensis]KAA8482455.1 family 43 glycosylhydrolase [Arcticibacter tournemirensis]TQM51657.1 carbohydrate binding protein with CBM6 domain [Arcticibacter tournemirensis]